MSEKKNKKTIFVHNMFLTCSELAIFLNNLSSYCGLTDSRMSASDTDLPVPQKLRQNDVVKAFIKS